MGEIIGLGRQTLQMAMLVAAPILMATLVVSLLINIVQVLTSIQDSTVSTVPRLAITSVTAILAMPWMLRRLATFTVELFHKIPQLAR